MHSLSTGGTKMIDEKAVFAVLAGLTLTGCPEARRDGTDGAPHASPSVSAVPVTATREGNAKKDGGKGSCGPGACG